VASVIKANLPISRSQAPYVDYGKDPIGYSEPIIYVFDMPKARQTLVTTYDQIKPQTTLKQRMESRIFNQYFGAGDMSSVLFQEVREFRSLAYSSSSRLRSRSLITHPNAPLSFITATGTQGDKAMKCIALIDSLFTDMPIVEKNFQTCRQGYINEMYTEFPSFRSMGSYIGISRINGYTNDPKTGVAPVVQSVTMDDMRRFYETNIKNNRNHRVYGIVGNKKKLDLKELQKYGRVVFVKEKDLFRK
jgi:predicted Zn-dependent peptidase